MLSVMYGSSAGRRLQLYDVVVAGRGVGSSLLVLAKVGVWAYA